LFWSPQCANQSFIFEFSSSDDDATLIESRQKKHRKRVRVFDDDSSNEPPVLRVSDGSSKENSGPSDKESAVEIVDDLQVMLEDDQSDLSEDSEYSDDEIVFDSDGEDSGEEKKVKTKGSKTESSSANLKVMILELINNGSEADMLNVPMMTRKKLDVILSMRPFESWSQTLTKFESSSALPVDLLEHVKNNVKSRYMITQLLTNCKRISDQIKNTVQNLKGLQQPKILSRELKLKPYQLIGLNWMAMMHEKGINGILADEMGLGKTVQVIALLAHLRTNKQIRGPHMVVVPASILTNWSREFSTWCPSIDVLEYHGSQAERAELRQRIYAKQLQYDVLLTTYNMCYSNDDRKLFTRTQFRYIIFDEAHMLKNMKSARFNNLISLKSKNRLMLTGTPIQNNLLELMTLLLFTMPNMFGSKRTHIESFFRDKKIETDTTGFVKSRIDQAKEILKPFILRRLKENVLKDLPSKIQKYEQIPMTDSQKKVYDEYIDNYKRQFAEMREEQNRIKKEKPEARVEIMESKRKRNIITYDEEKLLDAAHAETEEAIAEVYVSENSNDSVSSNSDNIELVKGDMKKSTAMLMELRKCANHPLLMRTNYTDELLMEMARTLKQKEEYYRADGNVQYIFEDMQHCNDFDLHALCKKFPSIHKHQLSDDHILNSGKFRYLDEFLPKLINEGQRVLIFSQFQMMLDILEEYLRIRKHRFVRLDGATKVTERMGIIDNFYEDKEIRVFLITTRAGGLGINLVEANHVVIHDIDFNPYNDKQAEDRAHRMGQKKEVYVFKLISSESIEVHMMNTCIRKLEVGRTITADQIEKEQGKAVEAKDIKAMLKNALKM
jgi:SWI/SNF-related matrix-associated actin-dependent regulator 1 of chromatin subfamily A